MHQRPWQVRQTRPRLALPGVDQLAQLHPLLKAWPLSWACPSVGPLVISEKRFVPLTANLQPMEKQRLTHVLLLTQTRPSSKELLSIPEDAAALPGDGSGTRDGSKGTAGLRLFSSDGDNAVSCFQVRSMTSLTAVCRPDHP